MGLPAGVDRRRAHAGRLRRRRAAGSRGGPLLLSEGSSSPYAPLFAAIGALLVGAVVAVTVESLALGLRARLVRGRALRLADGAGGAALIAAVALGLIWVFGAVALHAPGTAQLRGDVQRSLILRRLNDLLPPSGPVLNALNRVDPAPSIVGPTTPLSPPDPAVAREPGVRRASHSVVRVLGTACGLGVEGSGWVAAPGLVVTNAHVVAGEDDTTVTTLDGASLEPRPSTTTPPTTSRCCGSTPRSPLRSPPTRGPAPPARCSAIPKTAPTRSTARPHRRHQHRDQRGLLRQRPDPPLDRLPARHRPQRQLRRPLVDSRGHVMATVFAATTSGPRRLRRPRRKSSKRALNDTPATPVEHRSLDGPDLPPH